MPRRPTDLDETGFWTGKDLPDWAKERIVKEILDGEGTVEELSHQFRISELAVESWVKEATGQSSSTGKAGHVPGSSTLSRSAREERILRRPGGFAALVDAVTYYPQLQESQRHRIAEISLERNQDVPQVLFTAKQWRKVIGFLPSPQTPKFSLQDISQGQQEATAEALYSFEDVTRGAFPHLPPGLKLHGRTDTEQFVSKALEILKVAGVRVVEHELFIPRLGAGNSQSGIWAAPLLPGQRLPTQVHISNKFVENALPRLAKIAGGALAVNLNRPDNELGFYSGVSNYMLSAYAGVERRKLSASLKLVTRTPDHVGDRLAALSSFIFDEMSDSAGAWETPPKVKAWCRENATTLAKVRKLHAAGRLRIESIGTAAQGTSLIEGVLGASVTQVPLKTQDSEASTSSESGMQGDSSLLGGTIAPESEL